VIGIRLRAAAIVVAVALVSGACSFSPLNHHIKIGEESFAIFVAEGVDHHVDLFAVPGTGGTAAQLTFTALIETHPRLSPRGDVVAFLRMRDTLPGTPRDVVLMNLLGGGEVTIPMPASAGTPQLVAWADDETMLYIRTDRGAWQANAPPAKPDAKPVPAASAAVADSMLQLWLGTPRFARAFSCPVGICVVGANGDTTAVAHNGTDPMRWGPDSLAWFDRNTIVVRSLGPGNSRIISWENGPNNPHDGTFAAAPPGATDSL
jgi:hypothetical protein